MDDRRRIQVRDPCLAGKGSDRVKDMDSNGSLRDVVEGFRATALQIEEGGGEAGDIMYRFFRMNINVN